MTDDQRPRGVHDDDPQNLTDAEFERRYKEREEEAAEWAREKFECATDLRLGLRTDRYTSAMQVFCTMTGLEFGRRGYDDYYLSAWISGAKTVLVHHRGVANKTKAS